LAIVNTIGLIAIIWVLWHDRKASKDKPATH